MGLPLMARLADKSLSTRITLGALSLIVVVTLALIVQTREYERDHALESWRYQLDERARVNAAHLQRSIGDMRGKVLFFAKTVSTAGLIRAAANRGVDAEGKSSYEDWVKRIQADFMAFCETNPDVYQMRVIGMADGGRELVRVDYRDGRATATPPEQLQRKGDRDYFRAIANLKQGEVYLSDINLNVEHGKVEVPHVRTARAGTPLFFPDGRLFGMVVVNMNVGPLLDRVADDAPPAARTYLANDAGDYLIHPDAARTFGFDLGKRYRLQEDFPGLAIPGNPADGAASWQRISTPAGLFHMMVSRVAFDPLQPQRHLVLAYALPHSAIAAQVDRAHNAAMLGTLVVALAVACLFYLYVRQIFKPLKAITRAASEIGRGRYDTPLPEKATGEIAEFVKAFRQMLGDIRQREEKILSLNADLAQREKLANQIIDTVPEAIVVVDADGRIARANACVTRVFGYARDELIGRPLEMLLPARFRAGHVEMRKAYQAEAAQRMMGGGRDLYGLRKDGREVQVEVGLGPMRLDGETYVIAAIADISARKAAEAALRKSAEQLKRSNAELEQFAYVASHDLQEPLRSIAGPLQLLQKRYAGKLDGTADTFIDHAVTGATRMQQLIDDLLTYSRAGRSEKPFAPVDCNDLLVQVTRALSAAIGESGARVSWEKLPVIKGDRTQLYQLFQNLIGNAIKFRGERVPEIRIAAVAENAGGWRFTVEDNGIGIPSQHLERIFRIFQRLHTRREYPGTGIGLALCKRIVERHGGRIWVESEPGRGSRFIFQLADRNASHNNAEEEGAT